MRVDSPIWGEISQDKSYPIAYNPADSAGFLLSGIHYGSTTNTNGGLDVFSNKVGRHFSDWVSVFYNRVIFDPMIIDAGDITSDLEYEVLMSPCFERFGKLTFTQIDSSSKSVTVMGRQSGIALPWNLYKYKVHISRNGEEDLEAKLNWHFDQLASDAAVLPVVGSRRFIFEYGGNHPQNVSETFEFLTDISRTLTGEQRLSLRGVSRQTYSYDVFLFGDEQVSFAAQLEGLYAINFVFPLYHEGIKSEPVFLGDTVIKCDTTAGSFAESKQIIVATSSGDFISLKIGSIESDKIHLLAGIPSNLGILTVYPARSGLALSGIKSKVESSHTTVSIEWSILNPVKINSTPALTCRGIEVLNQRTAMSNRVGKMPYDTFDNKVVNPPDRYPKRAKVDHFYTLELRSINRHETYETRKLIDRLRGSYGLVYLPTWADEISISQSYITGATTLEVDWKGGSHVYKSVDTLYVEYAGKKQALETSRITRNGNRFTVSLTHPILYDMEPQSVTTFCRLVRARLDSDRITVKHGFNGMSVCNLKFMEA